MADEALSAGAAARRLGVAVTTLRTWHQRYGLGPSRHEPGHHRRYTVEDMGRLEVMLRLTAQGVAPAEAAAWAQRAPTPLGTWRYPGAGDPGLAPMLADDYPHGPAASNTPEDDPQPDDFPRAPRQARHGGGTAIPLTAAAGTRDGRSPGRVEQAARGLARAAMRLDTPAMRESLEAAVADRGVIDAWDAVIKPVLIGIGDRIEATQRYIEVEHLLSRCVTEVLGAVTRPPRGKSPRTLLAAANEEQHTLALEALAAALAQAGVPTRLLGARVPPRALLDAVTRTGPVAVILWSQVRRTAAAAQLEALLSLPRPPLLVAAAGPGWSPNELPAGVALLTDLHQAVHVIGGAVE